MNLFQFSPNEMITFFAVLVRYSILFSLLPLVGEKAVPATVKILLSLSVSICLYPGLIKSGVIHPEAASQWSATMGGIISTISSEALVGILLGFISKFAFDAINMGANFMGAQMGFSMATIYDPMQESHTIVISEIHFALAMLAFLAFDGHIYILKSALSSYEIVGLGQGSLSGVTSQYLIEMTGQLIKFAIQISAPVAIVMFLVNIVFGVLSRALPQMNILILSFAITTGLGMVIMFITLPEFMSISMNLIGKTDEWMSGILYSLHSK